MVNGRRTGIHHHGAGTAEGIRHADAASSTCRGPHSSRSCLAISKTWAQPVAPTGWPLDLSPPGRVDGDAAAQVGLAFTPGPGCLRRVQKIPDSVGNNFSDGKTIVQLHHVHVPGFNPRRDLVSLGGVGQARPQSEVFLPGQGPAISLPYPQHLDGFGHPSSWVISRLARTTAAAPSEMAHQSRTCSGSQTMGAV